MRLIATLGFLAIALSAMGQEFHQHDHGDETAVKSRKELIWLQANNRIVTQIDLWFEHGDFPRCIGALRYSATLNPSDYETWSNLGWMLENIQQYPAALEVYQEFRVNNPQDPDASYLEADLYFRTKKYDKVPPLLIEDVKRNPHANSFRILAHSYERLNRLEESRDTWKQYIALAPKDGAAPRNLARVEQKIKDRDAKTQS